MDPEMRLSWIIWVISKSSVRRQTIWRRETEGERKGCMKGEVEMGGVQSQAKKYLEPPEPGKGWGGLSLESLWGKHVPAAILISAF